MHRTTHLQTAMKSKSLFSLTHRAALLLLVGGSIASGQITYTRLLKNGNLQLHQMNANGGGDTTLKFPLGLVGFPRWSQNGSQLAVTAFQPKKVPTHTWNVYSMTNGTGPARKLTDLLDILDPDNISFSYTFPWYKAYSRNGKSMAIFSVTQTGGPSSGNSSGGVIDLPVLEIYPLAGTANPILVHVDKSKNGRHHGGEGVDWSPARDILAAPLESSAPFLSGGSSGETTAVFLIPPTLAAVQNGKARQVTFPRLLLDRARLSTTLFSQWRRPALCPLLPVPLPRHTPVSRSRHPVPPHPEPEHRRGHPAPHFSPRHLHHHHRLVT
jgi:hypothetical protein